MGNLPEGIFRKTAVIAEFQQQFHHRESMTETANIRPEKQSVLKFRQKSRRICMVTIQNHIRIR